MQCPQALVNGESDVTRTESQTTGTDGNPPHGNREIPATSASCEADRSAKARRHNADMHAAGKSDSFVVSEKRANNAGPPTAAESVEERRLPEKNAFQPLLARTQSRTTRSRGLSGVRETARNDKKAIVHPYPGERFHRQHSREEPYAVVPHVRICAGGTQ